MDISFLVPLCAARKPQGYWKDVKNLYRELMAFRTTHGGDAKYLPKASELLQARRFDLYRAVQRQGGFAVCAHRLGLCSARRPRGYWARALPAELRAFAAANGESNSMPSTSTLRVSGRTDILSAVQQAGGIDEAARNAGLQLRKRPRAPPAAHSRGERPTLDALQVELRNFAGQHCDGRQPLQRELATARRHDLLNALRAHGGLCSVSSRAGLAAGAERRPRGYWERFETLEAEIRAYTATRGIPGLMPRRDQLLRLGRRDLCYAIKKHGGFSAVSARLHLMWVGPSNYWRVFRNLRRRLLAFVKAHGPRDTMPTTLRLHRKGRTDLMYGVALHGGVMMVAGKVGLKVKFGRRAPNFWAKPTNITRELDWFLSTEPLENRTRMPSSVELVRAGRLDLANAVRDHGGWVYYAQRCGLRFEFARRVHGFWQGEQNVFEELMLYISERYGDWDFPGVVPEDHQLEGLVFMPSLEMLKRDGRSDIAFAVQRYQGGEQAFALRHGLTIAQDTVLIQPVETLKKWGCFSVELDRWISQYGTDGVMPQREDFIRTGRHDLRCAMFLHGGRGYVAKRIGLVFCDSDSRWIASWLALQAGKLGCVLLAESSGRGDNEFIGRFRDTLDGQFVGSECDASAVAISAFNRKVLDIRKKKLRRKREVVVVRQEDESKDRLGQISIVELDALREKYKHIASDDLIVP